MPVEPSALTTQVSQSPVEDYDAIHASAMETAQGRWFLQEFARRNRNADTTLLLAAIKRIELAVAAQGPVTSGAAVPEHPNAPPQSTSPAPPPRLSYGETAPFTHQLHELRDAIRLTLDSLPEIGSANNPDFTRIAKGISVVAARMRWIAEQVPEAQSRAIVTVHDDLDKLSEAATMVAALLDEIELRLAGLIDAAQAIVDAEAQAQALVAEAVFGAPPAAAHESTQPAEPALAEAQSVAEAVEADMRWLEMLAPTIVGRNPQDPPPDPGGTQFDFVLAPHVASAEPRAGESRAPIAMPNPAWREDLAAALAKPAESATPEMAQVDVEPELRALLALDEHAPAESAEIAEIAAAEVIVTETIAAEEAEWPPRIEAVAQPDHLLAMIQQAIERTIQETIQETIQDHIQEAIQETIESAIAETIDDTIEQRVVEAAQPPAFTGHIVAPAASHDEPREDPAAFDFDPFSHALQAGPHIEHAARADQPETIEPQPAIPTLQLVPPPPANDTGVLAAPPLPSHGPTPPLPPHRPRTSSDALAPIRALSDEERIALFS